MTGPPLLAEQTQKNSSCSAISQIIFNEQSAFPNVQLPCVDVRDVAKAHIDSIFLDNLSNRNDRFLMAAQSIWYKDICKLLQSNQDRIFDQIPHGNIQKNRNIGYITIKIASMIYPDLKTLIPFLNRPI